MMIYYSSDGSDVKSLVLSISLLPRLVVESGMYYDHLERGVCGSGCSGWEFGQVTG